MRDLNDGPPALKLRRGKKLKWGTKGQTLPSEVGGPVEYQGDSTGQFACLKEAIANQRLVWNTLMRMQHLTAQYALQNLPNPPRRKRLSKKRCRTCSSLNWPDFIAALPARRASGIGNWDPPKHTTCSGRPMRECPTYSAFWSVFGVRRPRLQVGLMDGLRANGAIGTPEEPAGFRGNLRAWRVLRYSGPGCRAAK